MGVDISPREAEVLDALADRLTNAEIAERMFISVRTVETYVSALLRKYDAANRRGLAAIGQRRRSQAAEASTSRRLPPAIASFIGRTSELAVLADGLAGSRLVSIVGPAGVGKTRLAIEAARMVQIDGADIAFCDLTPATDRATAASAIATAVGVAEEPSRPIRELLRQRLARPGLLLVLDNCEHIIDDITVLVADFLSAAGTLRVLATSREALAVPGELALPLAPLPIPDADLTGLDAVMSNDAVRLFADRAASTSADFIVDTSTAPAIASICRRLDGIPLALELAAAQVSALTPQQIDLRLRNRFELLRAPSRGRADRHRTLDAAVGWSYDLLEARERALLDRLAVFRGLFTLEAAEVVTTGPPIHSSEVLDLTARLVRKSLVVAQTVGVEKRFRLLETMREFGWQRLTDAGELEMWRSRHREWMFGRMRDAAAALSCSVVPAWLNALDEDLENIEAALDWSMTSPTGAAEALTVVRSLERYWMARGIRREHGIRWSTAAAERATTVGMAARVEGLLGAVLLVVWSDLPAGRTLAEKAAQLAAADGDPTARGYAQLAGVWVDLFAGVTDGIAPLVQRTAELIDPADVVRPWVGAAHAVLHGLTGDWAEAALTLNSVAAEAAAQDDAHMAGAWLSCAADFEGLTGDVGAARAHLDVGLHQAEITDCASCESLALCEAALLEEDPQARLTIARTSLRLADGIGEVWGALGALDVTVDALAAAGSYADAALLAGATQAMRAGTGFVSMLPGRAIALERGEAAARAALDPANYAALVRVGATLGYASAVAHALG